MKATYKKKTTSFEILENSFGGSFPSSIKLEAPPKLPVRIVEDSFIQKIIQLLSSRKQFRYLYSLTFKQSKNKLMEQYADTKELYVLKIVLSILPVLAWSVTFKKLFEMLLRQSPHEMHGYVSPIKKNNIYLFSHKIKSTGADVNQVISHENIHVLQASHGELDMVQRAMDIERVNKYCELHTNYNAKRESHVKYLFNKLEVEARVHELVSAFYISSRQFPLSRKEFIVCLLYSNTILEDIESTVEIFRLQWMKQRGSSDPKNLLNLLAEIKKYAIGMSITSPIKISTHCTVDLALMLNTINCPDELFNFISFKLPHYYCNVLKLYGAISASSKLQDEINKDRQIYDLKYKVQDSENTILT